VSFIPIACFGYTDYVWCAVIVGYISHIVGASYIAFHSYFGFGSLVDSADDYDSRDCTATSFS